MNALASFYRHEIVMPRGAARIMGISCSIILLILGAYIRVPLPFTPVPITLQTFFVILGAAILGRRDASISTLGYLALGGFGLPIFQGYGSGMLHIFGPTGGYLIGFIAASFVTGSLINARKSNMSFTGIIFSMALGQATIYAFGISQLAFILKIGIQKAIFLGFLPFIPGAFIKLMSAAAVYKRYFSK